MFLMHHCYSWKSIVTNIDVTFWWPCYAKYLNEWTMHPYIALLWLCITIILHCCLIRIRIWCNKYFYKIFNHIILIMEFKNIGRLKFQLFLERIEISRLVQLISCSKTNVFLMKSQGARKFWILNSCNAMQCHVI